MNLMNVKKCNFKVHTAPAPSTREILINTVRERLDFCTKTTKVDLQRSCPKTQTTQTISLSSPGKVWAAATLNQPAGRPGNVCQIFIHNVRTYQPNDRMQSSLYTHPQPPILTEEFDPEALVPSLTVEGDVMLKEYDVLAGDQGQVVKIARALHDLTELWDEKVTTKLQIWTRLDKQTCS